MFALLPTVEKPFGFRIVYRDTPNGPEFRTLAEPLNRIVATANVSFDGIPVLMVTEVCGDTSWCLRSVEWRLVSELLPSNTGISNSLLAIGFDFS